jgi:hypothetical protein
MARRVRRRRPARSPILYDHAIPKPLAQEGREVFVIIYAQCLTLCRASTLAETLTTCSPLQEPLACKDAHLCEAFSGPWPPSSTFDTLREIA